jgi:hypothetical protein
MTADHLKGLVRTTRYLTGREILVGVPESSTYRPQSGINNATIGYLNEFGSEAMNIPPRPHLVPGVQMVSDRIVAVMRNVGRAALQGQRQTVDAGLNAAGQIGASGVQRKITIGPFVPLAERTLKSRLRRGRHGTRPLIDTGAYRRSITYVLRERRGGTD